MVENIIHNFESKKTSNFSFVIFVIIVIAIVLGLGAGYIFSKEKSTLMKATNMTQGSFTPAKGMVYGSNDLTTFKDSVTGTVINGGIDGEGVVHLIRPGGDSQNVYLTSSIVDLSQFIGKKVKVYGQTQASKKAGWLLDVGRVEVLE